MAAPKSPPQFWEARRIRPPKPGGKQVEQLSPKGESAEGASAFPFFPPIAEVGCWLREGWPWFDLDQVEARVRRNKKAMEKSRRFETVNRYMSGPAASPGHIGYAPIADVLLHSSETT
jgi:hypothetical protein